MDAETLRSDNSPNIIGNDVEVRFVSVGNKSAEGKVDTGATTSCLHATNVSVNQDHNTVSFNSPVLSDNVVTMDLAGTQDVGSADGGNNKRALVKFDIEINGVPIQGATFNLNDRSNMDTMVLIGQNVLKAGNFQIDVNKDSAPERAEPIQSESTLDNPRVREALQILAENDVSMADIIKYYRTVAASSITF